MQSCYNLALVRRSQDITAAQAKGLTGWSPMSILEYIILVRWRHDMYRDTPIHAWSHFRSWSIAQQTRAFKPHYIK